MCILNNEKNKVKEKECQDWMDAHIVEKNKRENVGKNNGAKIQLMKERKPKKK